MATGRLPKRPVYLKIRTSKIEPDMTRYIAYDGEEESPTIRQAKWKYDTPWIHRGQSGEFTYFMRPSTHNDHWDRTAIDRYASFGVHQAKDISIVLGPEGGLDFTLDMIERDLTRKERESKGEPNG